ncbi:hypothetical protein TruAng_004146 [Truncatella angustata]|nr:hypothetical protein TruAng_004146 [Truncatella angustata]
MTVKDVPKSMIKRLEGAIFRIITSALSGTDLDVYHGVLGSSITFLTMGQEAIGVVVVEVGKAVDSLLVGNRVSPPWTLDDGHLETDGSLVANVKAVGLGEDLGLIQGCQGIAASSLLAGVARELRSS